MDFKSGKTVRAPRGALKKLAKHFKTYAAIAHEVGCSSQALSKIANGGRENCKEGLRDSLVHLLREVEGKSLNKPKPEKIKATHPFKGGKRADIPEKALARLVEHYGNRPNASAALGASRVAITTAVSRGYMGSKLADAIIEAAADLDRPPEPEPEPERPASFQMGVVPVLPGARPRLVPPRNGNGHRPALTPLSQRLAALAVEASGDGERLVRMEAKIDALGEIMETLLAAWEG